MYLRALLSRKIKFTFLGPELSPYVSVGVESLKDGHHPKTAFPARVCGGVCSLPHGKLSLADSVATEQSLPFQMEPMA